MFIKLKEIAGPEKYHLPDRAGYKFTQTINRLINPMHIRGYSRECDFSTKIIIQGDHFMAFPREAVYAITIEELEDMILFKNDKGTSKEKKGK